MTSSGQDEPQKPQASPEHGEQPEETAAAPAAEPTGWEPESRPSDEAVFPEPVFTPFSLTVGDGFKFGCGFTMALVIAALIGLLAISLVFLLAALIGAPLPVGR